MSCLTGVLKVQCTNDVKEAIRKIGGTACILIMDEIKNMDHVIDVWSPKHKRVDIIIEIDADNLPDIDNLEKNISQLEGVYQVAKDISSEIT